MVTLTSILIVILASVLAFVEHMDRPKREKLTLICLIFVLNVVQIMQFHRANTIADQLRATTGPVAFQDVVAITLGGRSGASIALQKNESHVLPGGIEVSRTDGGYFVRAKLRDSSGHVVAELLNNYWLANSGNPHQRNYLLNGRGLEVLSPSGDVALRVMVETDERSGLSMLVISGNWWDADGKPYSYSQAESGDSIIEIGGPGDNRGMTKVSPIFCYPSDVYLGQLAKDGCVESGLIDWPFR